MEFADCEKNSMVFVEIYEKRVTPGGPRGHAGRAVERLRPAQLAREPAAPGGERRERASLARVLAVGCARVHNSLQL